jgi:LmbE family N-acetylglucosaminyl deacetylase
MSRTELQAALKVFGIYEKAQLSRGSFWDSMGRELGKKGEEYKERSVVRSVVPALHHINPTLQMHTTSEHGGMHICPCCVSYAGRCALKSRERP